MGAAKDDEFTGRGSKRVEDVCGGEEGGKKFADDLLVLHGQIGNINFKMMGTGIHAGFVPIADSECSHFKGGFNGRSVRVTDPFPHLLALAGSGGP
jgi:hypothetical protein